MRPLVLVFLAWCLQAPVEAAQAASAAAPVTLKSSVVVSGPVVRLGDLFDGLTESAGLPVARAPEAGGKVHLDARWLAGIAHRFGVAWRPASLLDRAVVERSSQVIDSARIEAVIMAGVRDRGAEGDLSIQLDNPALSIRLPSEFEATLKLNGLSYDPSSGRFVAHIIAPDSDRPVTRSTISGRVHVMTEVPTLVRQIEPGSVIGATDIDWIKKRADRLGRGVVLDLAGLVGMSPRRPLRVGEPIRLRDLRQPVVVEKNSLVTIVFESDRMLLTAQGRALEDGASGAAIRVMNTGSNSVVNATVRSPSTVVVRHMATAAVN